MDLHEGPGNSLEGAFGYSTESLSRNSDVLEVIAPRLRRRSDRPSNVDAGRPTFSPDDRVSFDLHSHAVPAGSTPERAPRLSPSPSKISDPGLVIHAPIELAASAPSLRFQQLQVEDRPEPSARERVIQLRKGWVHFAAVCFAVFVTGWNDGSTGPLLPRIQAFYGVGFTVISLIFVVNCVGYVSGAVINIYLTDKLGFGKMLVLGAGLQCTAHVIQAIAGPFPLFVSAYFFAGLGLSFQHAHCNAYVGLLDDRTKMGFLQAAYGVGAFAAPLVAVHFVAQSGSLWSFHYLTSIALAALNVAALAGVFRLRRLDAVLLATGHEPAETGAGNNSRYGQVLGLKVVHLLAIWALAYVGVEYVLGGWMVTFIERERHGGPSTGYISSGFFGGLALGRVAFIGFNRLVGEGRAMYLYATLVIALQLTVWLVPSLIENALAISTIGLLLGPMYPVLMNTCSRIFPRRLLTGAISWVAAVGMSGSAALPFVSGLLAARFGVVAIQPLLITMMVIILGLWVAVPKGHARTD